MSETNEVSPSDQRERFKRIVMRLWEERVGYFAVFIASLVIAPAILTVSAFAISVWVTAPLACIFIFLVVLWSLAEWNINRNEVAKVSSFTHAARYMFEVAKHLEEIGNKGRVICSNDDFELHVRRKSDDA